MSFLSLLLACLLVGGFLVAIVAAYKVIVAYLAEDYLICPTCGHKVLHLGRIQKCDKCGTRVVVKKEGGVSKE